MGKKAKEHRKKVQKRNEDLKLRQKKLMTEQQFRAMQHRRMQMRRHVPGRRPQMCPCKKKGDAVKHPPMAGR